MSDLINQQILLKSRPIGFLVSDYQHRFNDFFNDVSGWLKSGELKYKEDVVVGLENAPHSFMGLLRGDNFGKLIVRVGNTT